MGKRWLLTPALLLSLMASACAPPATPAPLPTPDPTAQARQEREALRAYFAQLDALLGPLRLAHDIYQGQAQQEGLSVAQQVESASRLRDRVQTTAEQMQRMAPPTALAESHQEYVQGLLEEKEGLDSLLRFLANYQTADANESAIKFQQAAYHYRRAQSTWAAYRDLVGMPEPTHLPTPTPAPTPTLRPTLTPAPLPTATAGPTPAIQPAIEAALWDYTRLRAQAEAELDPEALRQICVDPYLTQKTERIRQNIRDGSHWETWSADFRIVTLSQLGSDTVDAWVTKTETKVFFPKGATLPDDMLCSGEILSYRNCTYNARYTLVLREGRWYVSEVQDLGPDCPRGCQRIAPDRLTLSAALALPGRPHAMARTPDGRKLYVVDMPPESATAQGRLWVVDPTANAVVGTIPLGRGFPFGLAVTPDGKWAYVAISPFSGQAISDASARVEVIDTATDRIAATILIPGTRPAPTYLAVTPDGREVYVTDRRNDRVVVLDTASKTIVRNIAVGSQPVGIAIAPDGRRAYVANRGDSTLTVIDVDTGQVVGTIRLSIGPSASTTHVAITPDGTRAYATYEGDARVAVIDIDRHSRTFHQEVDIIPCTSLNLRGIAIGAGGRLAIVAGYDTGDAVVLDIDPYSPLYNTEIAVLPAGSGPVEVLAVPTSDVLFYVAGADSGTVSVIIMQPE